MNTHFAPATLTICLDALVANYRLFSQAAGAANCAAVVKANAYGLGVKPVAQALEQAGCEEFFVANLDEGIELRGILSDAIIYVFFGVQNGEEAIFAEHNLIPVLNDFYQIALWESYSRSSGAKPARLNGASPHDVRPLNTKLKTNQYYKLPAIIHIDSGMNRLGLNMQDGESLSKQPELYAHLDIKYIMSHLSCISDPHHPKNARQIERFSQIKQWFAGTPVSLNNSGGIFNLPSDNQDMVRAGISLYGSNSVPEAPQKLSNVVRLEARIIQVREIIGEQTISYGATCKVNDGTIIATVPVGYADGYIRSLSNNNLAYIDGQEVPLVGRISMDSTMFDISNIPEEKRKVGTIIELIGDNMTIDQIAHNAGTIGYEILTNLGARYKRIYIGG